MRILIVDDSDVTAESLEQYFQLAGHEAGHAATGDRALQMLREGGYDAVVLDQRLQTCYGLDVLREVRRVGMTLPVIMATAVDAVRADELRHELAALGPAELVRKPYSPRELLAALESLKP